MWKLENFSVFLCEIKVSETRVSNCAISTHFFTIRQNTLNFWLRKYIEVDISIKSVVQKNSQSLVHKCHFM